MAKKVISKKSNSNYDSYLFTSESVTMGHPDKVCDNIGNMYYKKIEELYDAKGENQV